MPFRGSSGSSIKRIRQRFPAQWVNVSATPWEVNEDVLGVVKNHITYTSFEEAYNGGYLNPLILHRVDVGNEMTLKALELEKRTGMEMYQLAEKSPEDLVKVIKRIGRKRGVRVTAKDVEDVVKHRIRVAIELYAELHLGEKALFWMPNISYVKYAVEYFNDVMSRKVGEGAWGEGVFSENTASVNEVIIDDFLKSEDKRALFVVFMLSEGYNNPELRLGFDCSFSPTNIRRMLQKIGRTLRSKEGKGTSHYYYMVDVRTLLSRSGRVLRVRDDFQTPESLAHLSPDDVDFGIGAMADRFTMFYSGEGGFNGRDVSVSNEEIKVDDVSIENTGGSVRDVPFFCDEEHIPAIRFSAICTE